RQQRSTSWLELGDRARVALDGRRAVFSFNPLWTLAADRFPATLDGSAPVEDISGALSVNSDALGSARTLSELWQHPSAGVAARALLPLRRHLDWRSERDPVARSLRRGPPRIRVRRRMRDARSGGRLVAEEPITRLMNSQGWMARAVSVSSTTRTTFMLSRPSPAR